VFPDSPGTVANAANASYCDDSGYNMSSKLSGEKDTIYGCQIGSRMRCVTYSGRIANDATLEVRFALQNTLGASNPSCLG
jgi:hypothetical protein